MKYANSDDLLDTMRPALREQVLEVIKATEKAMNGEPIDLPELVINRIPQEAIDNYWEDVLKKRST